jgi:hypothetical protein
LLPPRAHRTQQGHQIGIGGGQPISGADGDGEEAHQHHDDHLGQQPEAEPDDQERGDGEYLHRLRGDQDRVQRPPQKRRDVDGRRQSHAEDQRNHHSQRGFEHRRADGGAEQMPGLPARE